MSPSRAGTALPPTEAFADNSEDVSVGAQTCREDNGDTNTATQDTAALPCVESVSTRTTENGNTILAVFAHRRGLPNNNHVSRACDAVVKRSEGEPERHPTEG